jgi:hypothetical protein
MNDQETPIELECWLIRHGILESKTVAVTDKVTQAATPAWKPEFKGQEPPF